MQLSEMIKNLSCVSLLGVIGPEPVPESTVLEFYTDYLKFRLYQDDDWQLFTALGNRHFSLWSLLSQALVLELRNRRKGMRSVPISVGGDIWTQGGILIFDKAQRLRFVYRKMYGDELDKEAIVWAIEEARRPWSPVNELDGPRHASLPLDSESSHA